MQTCINCGTLYRDKDSSSSLRLTYCTVLCEVKDLGFHLKSLEEGKYRTSVFEEPVLPIVEDRLPVQERKDDDNDDRELVYA